MQRLITSRRALVSLAALLCLLTASLSTFASTSYAHVVANPSVSLSNSYVSAPAGAILSSHHAQSAQLTVGLVLQPSNATQLDSLLADLYNPSSSRYHQWLATGQFAATFAPSANVVAQAQNFLTSAGLTLTTSSTPFLIEATGTTSQIEAAFKTNINDYVATDGQAFYQNDTVLQVPASMSSSVVGIVGLSNTALHHRFSIRTDNAIRQAGRKPLAYGAGPGGSGLVPSQLAGIYGANQVYKLGARGQGKGATLAVFELSGYTPADVAVYEHTFFGASENVPLININVDGGPITPKCPKGDTCNPPKDYSGDSEVEGDIETQIAIAPKVNKVLVYNAPNSNLGLGAIDEYARIANDNLADSISSSWGLCELDEGFAAAHAESLAFKQMAAQGQSMFAAAGDTGAYDCLRGSGSTKLAVDDPASQPYVTGVGGTSFNSYDPAKNLHPSYPQGFETVWNPLNLCSGTSTTHLGYCANFGAGGGGVSNFWGKPDYQYGPGVISSYSQKAPYCSQATSGQYCREVPDVSAVADEFTPYAFYCTGVKGTNSDCATFASTRPVPGWVSFGGTSFATPLWAGIIALSVGLNGERFGNANQTLYKLFRSDKAYSTFFHDITGKNQSINQNGFYPVTPNYDLATGIGTPRISAIAKFNG